MKLSEDQVLIYQYACHKRDYRYQAVKGMVPTKE